MSEKIKKKRVRSGENQMEYLIDYMLKHKTFAVGKFQTAQGRQTVNEQWKALSESLNELGPTKSVDQWKKVWKNQKIQTRKRASDIKIAERRTGNFTPPPPLSEKEKKILSVIGNETSEGLGFGEGFVGETTETVIESNSALDNVELDYSIEYREEIMDEGGEGLIEEGDHTYYVDETRTPNKNDAVPSTSKGTGKRKSKQQTAPVSIDHYSELVRGTNEGLEKIAAALNKIGDSMLIMAEVMKNFFENQSKK